MAKAKKRNVAKAKKGKPRKPKKKPVHKTFDHFILANSGKEEQVRDVLPPYQKAMSDFIIEADKGFLQGIAVPRYTNAKPEEYGSILTARQFCMAYIQMTESFASYEALFEIEFRDVVEKSNLDSETKHILHCINLFHAWYKKELLLSWVEKDGKQVLADLDKETDFIQAPVPAEFMKLARYIMKRVKKRVGRPDLRHCNVMKFDAKVIVREPAKTSKKFRYWVKFSTLTRGKPIYMPLANNPYFEKLEKDERVISTAQLKVCEDHLELGLTTESKAADTRKEGGALGVDFGLVHLFTTSDGQTLGTKSMKQLRRLDRKLTRHAAKLQRQGLKVKGDHTHDKLVKQIQGLVKNEVGRLLNQMSKKDIKEIVFEDLDFRFGGLSKTTNRVLTKAGLSTIKAKQERLRELDGIKVTKVDPAYTSQMCSNCGYVSDKNRLNQREFRCGCCGLSINADVNAAKNIRSRRSRSGSKAYSRAARTRLRDKLDVEHAKHCVSGKHSRAKDKLLRDGRKLEALPDSSFG